MDVSKFEKYTLFQEEEEEIDYTIPDFIDYSRLDIESHIHIEYDHEEVIGSGVDGRRRNKRCRDSNMMIIHNDFVLDEPEAKKVHREREITSNNFKDDGNYRNLLLAKNLECLCLILEERGIKREDLHEFLTGKKTPESVEMITSNCFAVIKTEPDLKMIIKGSTARGTLKEVGESGLLTLDLNNGRMKNYCLRWEGIDSKYMNKKLYSFSVGFDLNYLDLCELLEKIETTDMVEKKNLESIVVNLKNKKIKEKCKDINKYKGKEAIVIVKKENFKKNHNFYESHVFFKMPKIGDSGIIYLCRVFLFIENKQTKEFEREYLSDFCFRKNGNKSKKYKETFNRIIGKMECKVHQKNYFIQ